MDTHPKPKTKAKAKTGFQVPTLQQRRAATGLAGFSTKAYKSHTLKRILELYADDTIFSPIPQPEKGDWLAEYKEPYQNAKKYSNNFRKPTHQKNRVYILPIGDFIKGESPDFKTLEHFAKIYLQMPVVILPQIKLQHLDSTHYEALISERAESPQKKQKNKNPKIEFRLNPYTEQVQLLTGDLERLLKIVKPKDAYCIVGLTMFDLYPDQSWNFVFGEADPGLGVGVFSFARYHPDFNSEKDDEKKNETGLNEKDYGLLLKRSCQVMVHEVIHMFDFEHCVFYDCCMNGANSLEESDIQRLDLCPVCLHKLWIFRGCVSSFGAKRRYLDLLRFYETHVGFEDDIEWSQKILELLKDVNDEDDDKIDDFDMEDDDDEIEMKDANEHKDEKLDACKKRREVRVTLCSAYDNKKKILVNVTSLDDMKRIGVSKLRVKRKNRATDFVFHDRHGHIVADFSQVLEDGIYTVT